MDCNDFLKKNDINAYFKCQDEEAKIQKEIERKKIEAETPRYIYGAILSPVGFLGGIGYAFAKKTGFWKGFGLALLGSIVLGGVGYGIDRAVFEKNKKI